MNTPALHNMCLCTFSTPLCVSTGGPAAAARLPAPDAAARIRDQWARRCAGTGRPAGAAYLRAAANAGERRVGCCAGRCSTAGGFCGRFGALAQHAQLQDAARTVAGAAFRAALGELSCPACCARMSCFLSRAMLLPRSMGRWVTCNWINSLAGYVSSLHLPCPAAAHV